MCDEIETIPLEQYSEVVSELNMLHSENALKLKQILDLEEILYATRKTEFDDDCGACWCEGYIDDDDHTDVCEAARQATKHLWIKAS